MISVVIPILNESGTLPELHRELHAVLEQLNTGWEIIYINDGSSDTSAERLDKFAEQDDRVRVIHFKRNFGQTAAMMAGFDHSRGDVIVPMDGDLQNDPRDIPKLLEKLESGFDLCSGWRRKRQDGFWTKRVVSSVANALISKMTGVKLHDFGCSLKAYRKEIIKDVRLYGEMHRFIPIYASWHGARIVEVPVNHRARSQGDSNYGLERTYKVVLDLMVVRFMDRFMGRPIHLFGGIGCLSLLISLVAATAAIYYKFFGGKSFIETPLPLMSAMAFVTSVLFVMLGLLAEIITRTYFESQGKATYLIERTRNIQDPSTMDAKTSS